jgi:hypothetical protein
VEACGVCFEDAEDNVLLAWAFADSITGLVVDLPREVGAKVVASGIK